MSNIYGFKKSQLVSLWEQKAAIETISIFGKYLGRYSPQEIVKHASSHLGEIGAEFSERIKQNTSRTENVEAQIGIDCADLIFGESTDVQICFQMKDSFKGASIRTWEDFVDQIDDHAEFDCLIRHEGKGLKLQIKRYPQQYHPHTNAALVDFIRDKNASYGNMWDVALIILLQPNVLEETELDFKSLHEQISSLRDYLVFSQIGLFLNINNDVVMLLQVYPELHKLQKKIVWRSKSGPKSHAKS